MWFVIRSLVKELVQIARLFSDIMHGPKGGKLIEAVGGGVEE